MYLNMTNAQVLSADSGGVSRQLSAPAAATTEHPADTGRRLLALARAGDVAGVRACMAGGAPFAADWLGNTPLHAAAAGDHADVIAVLLRAGGLRDARTKTERTPLHVASWLGHVAATRALLAGGADVGARDMLRMTPLHWAAQRGHSHVAGQLLSAGADPAVRNKFHLTARDLACRAQHAAIVDLIDAHQRRTDHQTQSQRMQDEERHTESPAAVDGDDPAELLRIPVASSPPAAPESGEGEGAATLTPELLLQRHGITLLGGDADGTVLRALSNGRTVVLSDAGKLMLKEASQPPPPPPPAQPVSHGMVVRATAVRSPPARGTVFAVNARLNGSSTPRARPVRKVIHPKDLKLDGSGVRAGVGAGGRVKIVMNRANFRRLVESANAGNTAPFTIAGATDVGATPAASERVSQTHTDTNNEPSVGEAASRPHSDELTSTRTELSNVRSELDTTRNELTAVRDELATTRDELTTTRNELTTTSNKLEQLEVALRSAGFELAEWDT